MIIKTYDSQTLQEKETISKITSIIFNRRFYKVGSFELQTVSNKIKAGDIIAYSYNGEIRSGIVMKITENNYNFTVSGYDLKCLYGFRYITEPEEMTGTADSIIKALVNKFLKTGDRNIEKLTVASNSIGGQSFTYTPEEGFLDKTIEELGKTYEVGTAIEFDLTSLHFKVLKGEDKTANIKFGRKFRNIEKLEHTVDLFNTYNVGYYRDAEETVQVSGSAKGILRRECYKKDNIAEYLAEKAPIETLRGEANERYRYGIDYKLGDYVTVMTDNLSTIKQITEIKEVHENSRHTIIPIFGVEKENPINKIMKGM